MEEKELTWDEVITNLEEATTEMNGLLFEPEHEQDLIDLQKAEERDGNFKN